MILYPNRWSAPQASWSDSIRMLNNGVRGQNIYFWPRLILSVYPLQLTPNLWLLINRRKSTLPFYVPGLARKTMWCTHIIQTHPLRCTCACPLPHGFLLSFFIRELDPSPSKWKRAAIKLCWRILLAMYYTCRKRGVKNRHRKERHTVLHEHTHLFQYSRNPSMYLLVKSN